MPLLGVIPMRSFHRKEIRAVAASLVMAVGWFGHFAGENSMTFTRIEYLTSEIMGPPEALIIDSSGAAHYESHTNLPQGGGSAVGTYATKLTASEIKALEAALAKPPFRDLSDHWGKIASGERYKLIRVSGETGNVEKRIGTAKPVA